MEVLELLKHEDDNPRGQGGNFRSGATLEEAAAAEEARKAKKAERWPIGRQEAGILHLIQAKSLFERLRLPEPRWDDAAPRWDVTQDQVVTAYEQAKKCCHPEWSTHPHAERGFALLREAYETLSNANGRRDRCVHDRAAQLREREQAMKEGAGAAGSSGVGLPFGVGGSRSAAAAAAAADAAELHEQMAAKRKRLAEAQMRRGQQQQHEQQQQRRRLGSSSTAPPTGIADEEDDADQDDYVDRRAASAGALKAKAKKRRPGMM